MNKYLYQSIKTFIPKIECSEKYECLKKMAEELSAASNLDADEVYNLIKAREKFGSTALGGNFAIPHSKTSFVDDLICGVFTTEKPIDFGSIDGADTNIFFVLLAPSVKPSILLKALAKIAKIFKDEDLKEKIINAKSLQEIIEIIKEKELLL